MVPSKVKPEDLPGMDGRATVRASMIQLDPFLGTRVTEQMPALGRGRVAHPNL